MKVKDSVVVRPPFEEIHESRIGIEDPAGRGGIALYRFGLPNGGVYPTRPCAFYAVQLVRHTGHLSTFSHPRSVGPTIRMSARQALYVVGELAARTKATRKTIESGIPENCPVELPFWTR